MTNILVNLKNTLAIKNMLELIAERSGDDRADVFMDIIIEILLSKGDLDVWNQQKVINRIAEIYNADPPTLTVTYGVTEEIPF